MSFTYTETFNSPTFIFQVGADAKEFVLHCAAVARLSEPLGRLMDYCMQNGIRKAWFAEDDVRVFENFCQFIYTSDYPSTLRASEGNITGWGPADSPCRHPTSWTPRQRGEDPWTAFQNMSFAPGAHSPTSGFGYGNNHHWGASEPAPFTLHVSTVVFAARHRVVGLQHLALSKLHHELCNFRLRFTSAREIINLLSFCYQDTTQLDLEPLRKLVVRYVACKVDLLADHPDFQHVLQSSSILAWDLVRAIADCRQMETASGFNANEWFDATDPWVGYCDTDSDDQHTLPDLYPEWTPTTESWQSWDC